jgi:hypothetical protein
MSQPTDDGPGSSENGGGPPDEGGSGLAEQLARGLLNPRELVIITRDRLQEAIDEIQARGRLTREDANELVAELLRRGRQQTEELMDRARRTVAGPAAFPIPDYDELTARQVCERLGELTPAQLRRVREYELRHANRKSVLAAVEKASD